MPDAVFGFLECEIQGQALAKALGVPYETVEVHYFPDSECKVRIKGRGRRPALYRPLHFPNAKLVEVILAASVLRQDGGKDIGLIAPYLPYMRQDMAFRPGEAVSQKIVGRLLAGYFDRFIAVDPHLHRTSNLSEVFGGKPALALSGAAAMTAHLRARQVPSDVVLIGPDEESTPLVRAVAEPLGLKWTVCTKERKGDRDVRIIVPTGVVANKKSVVIVDDVVSSGVTIITLARTLRDVGVRNMDVYTTHALFDEKTKDEFTRASIRRIVSCDGVPHPTNAMSIVDIIVGGLNASR
jgi:ribose-phosphate pyrophosphokinase